MIQLHINDLHAHLGQKGVTALIGSRRLPGTESLIAFRIGFCMVFMGYRIASGKAAGFDEAAEQGARFAYDTLCKISNRFQQGAYENIMDIFMPYPGFMSGPIKEGGGYHLNVCDLAYQVAKENHYHSITEQHKESDDKFAWWESKPDWWKSIQARNSLQILRKDCATPVNSVICYTPDGVTLGPETTPGTGGTGQAIRVAHRYGVPVYNFGNQEHLKFVTKWLDNCQVKLQERFGIDMYKLTHDFYSNYSANIKIQKGSLIRSAERGAFDVVVHDCDCLYGFSSPIGNQIKDVWSDAHEVDQLTEKGNKKKKLGSFSEAEVQTDSGTDLLVLNAYTKYRHTNKSSLNTDYEALRKFLKASLNTVFKKRVAMPFIGNNDNIDRIQVMQLIAREWRGVDVTIFE